jgi:ParB family chromosome partitioning protein
MLIGHPDAEELAERIVVRGLNVRQVEAIVRAAPKGAKAIARAARAAKNADTAALEKRLADALGLAVSIEHRERGGTLAIRYRSIDQLDEVVRRLEAKR